MVQQTNDVHSYNTADEACPAKRVDEMPHKRESFILNANAAEFVPVAVQQSQWGQQHVAQRAVPAHILQSPSESSREPYGYAGGAIPRPTSNPVRPAVSGTRGGSVGPGTARLAYSIIRDNHLYDPYASNPPIEARPGTTQFQVTGYSHRQDSFAPSCVPDSIDAASARLLSIRYGFDPNDLTLSAAQLPIAGHGDCSLPSLLGPESSHRFSGSSTGKRFRKLNQHEAFDNTRATDPGKLAAEVSTTPTGPTQNLSDNEAVYEDGPEEAIWTQTSYIGPEIPQKYSSDDEMMFDKNGNDIQWEEQPLPPPLPRQKRILPPKPSRQGRIPLYGVLGGMQYDHNSKLYYGDGLPRPTPFRPNGTGPCTPGQIRDTEVASISVDTRKLPSDILHLQPMLEVGENLLRFGVHGIATMRFCRCMNIWRPKSAMTEHVCTEPSVEDRVQATPVRPKKASCVAWVPGLKPVSRHGQRGLSQVEKNLCATNNDGVAMEAGDGDRTGVDVHDCSEFFVDRGGEKVFTGPSIRDFGAKNECEAVTSGFLE